MTTLASANPMASAAPVAHARSRSPWVPRSFWQRYRVIIIAVTLFIVIDLGVLVLNFYSSVKISEDAIGVNLSGRQRMLSQRMTKALLTVDIERRDGRDTTAAREEFKRAVGLFEQTLKGFDGGATVPGGDGKPVHLPAAAGDAARQAMGEALALWAPYRRALTPVLEGRETPAELAAAVAHAHAHNVQLLGLMNDLTTALEKNATERANFLRLVQAAGILLALLNFAYILYKFLSSLRRADEAILAVNEENREILGTVREGLFLLQPDFTLGIQISRSVGTLLGKTPLPGDRLLDLLGPLLFEKDLRDARDYMELLFSPHVRENLVQGVNPLTSVEVRTTNARGLEERKFLSFSFNRVIEAGQVRHLLVTMQDITPRMALEQQLEAERSRARQEFSSLVQALRTDAGTLRSFVSRAEAQLLQVNDLLRSLSDQHFMADTHKTLDKVFRLIHTFKGEAAALNMELLAGMAHSLEDELQRLRNMERISGEALVNLPLALEGLLEKVGAFKMVAQAQPAESAAPDAPASAASPEVPGALHRVLELAQRAATDLGKQVRTRLVLENGAHEHPLLQDAELVSMAIQLARNAVAHGIETPAERIAAGKAEAGLITLTLARRGTEGLELRVRDDGRGLHAAAIRQRLLDLGWYQPEQLDQFSERQITAHIFKPGFTTAEPGGVHAGRGVGLDAVQQTVSRMGAQIRLQSTPGQGTEFSIILA
jgi:HPt (histidine-containing phosphotransfer) domain-containing protein/two-component sensor histidine kinase